MESNSTTRLSLPTAPLNHYHSGPLPHATDDMSTHSLPNTDPLDTPTLNLKQQDNNDRSTGSPPGNGQSSSLLDFTGTSSLSSSVSSTPFGSNLRGSRHSSPYVIPIQNDDEVVQSSSPVLRPASGHRIMGGMKKLLIRKPTGNAGVATSTAHADVPSVAIVTNTIDPNHSELEQTDRRVFINKVLTHIKRPRNPPGFSRLRRRHNGRKVVSTRQRSRNHHHHYSDDGYTSDPGLLRDSIVHVVHEEDGEEEDDTESGDPDMEQHRAQRIAAIEQKLEKYKKMLQEEESILQGFENEYVMGMEGSMSDKETHRIKQKFFTKQSKAKEAIEQLKKKVGKYEDQLDYIKQGGEIVVPSTHAGYGKRMRTGFKIIGGMGNELKERIKLKRKKTMPQATVDEDDDELEGMVMVGEEDDMLEEPHSSFVTNEMIKDSHNCAYCVGDYSELLDRTDKFKLEMTEIKKQYSALYEKLLAERDKSDRLESELNTLMDLHQHGVTELREQLTQMERLTFSKNQDLEDTIESCQSRIHKLEVEMNTKVDEKKAPVPSGWIRRLFVPLLTLLLDFVSFAFRISEHVGKWTVIAVVMVLLAVVLFYWLIIS